MPDDEDERLRRLNTTVIRHGDPDTERAGNLRASAKLARNKANAARQLSRRQRPLEPHTAAHDYSSAEGVTHPQPKRLRDERKSLLNGEREVLRGRRLPSLTLTRNEKEPWAVGLPRISPCGVSLNPGGNRPELIVHVKTPDSDDRSWYE